MDISKQRYNITMFNVFCQFIVLPKCYFKNRRHFKLLNIAKTLMKYKKLNLVFTDTNSPPPRPPPPEKLN